MPTWEYHVATSGTLPGEISNECEIAGADGWNLVSVILVEAAIALPGEEDELKTRLIFKRKVAKNKNKN